MMRPDLPSHTPNAPGDYTVFRNPRMPQESRYALLREPTKPGAKPVVFDTLATLAAAIHRERKDEPIQLSDAPIFVDHETEQRQGVSVWTVNVDGDRSRYLGRAWLNGCGRTALQSALAASGRNPAVPVIRKAA